jgi:hypothetical protein
MAMALVVVPAMALAAMALAVVPVVALTTMKRMGWRPTRIS